MHCEGARVKGWMKNEKKRNSIFEEVVQSSRYRYEIEREQEKVASLSFHSI